MYAHFMEIAAKEVFGCISFALAAVDVCRKCYFLYLI